MDKSYFETRKTEIQSEIDSWKQKLKDLEDEYISSNQKFPIGSKVCITTPAHTEACKGETFTESIYSISTLPVRYDGIYDFLTAVNDMILSIFGLAKHLDIDLLWHIEQKMKYNQLREKMHGKKY